VFPQTMREEWLGGTPKLKRAKLKVLSRLLRGVGLLKKGGKVKTSPLTPIVSKELGKNRRKK